MKPKTKLRKLFSMLLALIMIIGVFAAAPVGLSVSALTGKGTQDNPYCPQNWAELKEALYKSGTAYIRLGSHRYVCQYNDYVYAKGTKHLILAGESEFSGAEIANGFVEVMEDTTIYITGTGKLNYSSNTLAEYEDEIPIFRVQGRLIVESGTFMQINGYNSSGEGSTLFRTEKNGKIKIYGGVFEPKKTCRRFTYVYGSSTSYIVNSYSAVFSVPTGGIEIYGGLFKNAYHLFHFGQCIKNGNVSWYSNLIEEKSSVISGIIKGGIYEFPVSHYEDDEYRCADLEKFIKATGSYNLLVKDGDTVPKTTPAKDLFNSGVDVLALGGYEMMDVQKISVNNMDCTNKDSVDVQSGTKPKIEINVKLSDWAQQYFDSFDSAWLLSSLLESNDMYIYDSQANKGKRIKSNSEQSDGYTLKSNADGSYSYILTMPDEVQGGYYYNVDVICGLFNNDEVKLQATDEHVDFLNGTITLTSAYYNNPVSMQFSDRLEKLANDGKLTYKWEKAASENSTLYAIDGATSRSYTPKKEDVNQFIRLVVSDNGVDVIASNMIKVEKSPVNFTKPTGITLENSSDYKSVIIKNAKAAQEYIVSYDSTAPEKDSEKWDDAAYLTADGELALNCDSNTLVYVHTRVRESDYAVAGMYTATNSIYTGETTTIKAIKFNYDRLDMKVGAVATLVASPVPSNVSGWTGANWYVSGTGAELYTNSACTIKYNSATHGYKTVLYLKATNKSGDISVGAEKTVGYNSIVRGTLPVNVTDEDGNYALRNIVFPEITFSPGGGCDFSFSTFPSPSVIEGELTFTKYSSSQTDNISITADADACTATVIVPTNTEPGKYIYEAKVDGSSTKMASFLTINVTDGTQNIPLESISVSPEVVTLAPGQSYKFNVITNPLNATVNGTPTWEWMSGSTDVSIDSTGTVTVAEDAPDGYGTSFRATYGGVSALFTVKIAAPKYAIDVVNGKAYNSKEEITEATSGYFVIIKADEAPAGKVFDKWVVLSGDVTFNNAESKETVFEMTSGSVSVMATYTDADEIMYGDLTRDGKVNLMDLVALRKYLAKWSIDVDTAAADCNADGKVNLMDLILLRKYLAKWSVTLGK